jgi:hypothetical protein
MSIYEELKTKRYEQSPDPNGLKPYMVGNNVKGI